MAFNHAIVWIDSKAAPVAHFGAHDVVEAVDRLIRPRASRLFQELPR